MASKNMVLKKPYTDRIRHKSKQLGNMFETKLSTTYGYMCPRCLRIYSMDINVSINGSLMSKTRDSNPSYSVPLVRFMPMDGIDITCPECNPRVLIPVNISLGEILRIFRTDFGFDDVRISRPISNDGRSYAQSWIEIYANGDSASIKKLTNAAIYVNKTGIECFNGENKVKTSIQNNVLTKTIYFEDTMTSEMTDLLDRAGGDCCVKIEEVALTDIISIPERQFFLAYLRKLIQTYNRLIEEEKGKKKTKNKG